MTASDVEQPMSQKLSYLNLCEGETRIQICWFLICLSLPINDINLLLQYIYFRASTAKYNKHQHLPNLQTESIMLHKAKGQVLLIYLYVQQMGRSGCTKMGNSGGFGELFWNWS